jgi:hypothetical protein
MLLPLRLICLSHWDWHYFELGNQNRIKAIKKIADEFNE